MRLNIHIDLKEHYGLTYQDIGAILAKLIEDEFTHDANPPIEGEGYPVYDSNGFTRGGWLVESDTPEMEDF